MADFIICVCAVLKLQDAPNKRWQASDTKLRKSNLSSLKINGRARHRIRVIATVVKAVPVEL